MEMQMKGGRVIIAQTDYEELILKKQQLQQIKDMLYDEATLSYKKGWLNLDTSVLSGFLKATDEVRYKYELGRLEEEKARREAEERDKVID